MLAITPLATMSVKKLFIGGHENILKRTEESFSYISSTDVSRAVYEELLQVMNTCLGDQPSEIMADAAEQILQVVKNDDYRDDEKYRETAKFLPGMPSHEFSPEDDGDGMDKEMGVAVVFDGDDQEEGSDNDEIRDDDDDGDELMREGMRLIDWMMNEGINGGLDDIDAFWLQREQGAHGSSKRSRMRSDLRSRYGGGGCYSLYIAMLNDT
ncbi:hypothetical protein B5M09_004067 [Aphanomyces astaci]|uniref:Pre-mRNA-splicing helicase BRR2-like plug domain-containing protein n=1 Tax=Aphanomyces astaci TaxID=112090 RepID=A0A425CR64_APHAT|nr:hypothetical protein B5M09_004067 [Aphanomyces astaci]